VLENTHFEPIAAPGPNPIRRGLGDRKQYPFDGAIMAAEEVRRTVEDLAQALYEEKDPSGIPWVKRGQAVRDPWLRLAQKQIAESDESAKG
jgi:hypothetical protein